MINRTLLAVSLLIFPGAACAAEAASPQQVYQDVMRAQYAARQAPAPMSAEEAQRIYDAYLKTIGQPAPQRSGDFGAGSTNPSR